MIVFLEIEVFFSAGGKPQTSHLGQTGREKGNPRPKM
jgi:hypothetical protein